MRSFIYFFLLILLTGCAYESDPDKGVEPKKPAIRINEVVSNNCTGIFDAYGKTSNWVELYNQSDEPVNLSDYYLSDDSDDPLKWQIGNRILAPGEYELIYLSGQDFTDTGVTPDRVEVAIQYASGWSDDTLGGFSFVHAYEFDTIVEYFGDGTAAASAVMYLGDNVKEIKWKGDVKVDVVLNVKNDTTGSEYVNLGDYNQIEFKGYFEKDKKFQVGFQLNSWGNFEEEGLVSYSGLVLSFVGTGEKDGHYTLQLNKSENDNLVAMDELRAIYFSHSHIDDSVHFTLREVCFSSTIGRFHSSFRISETGDELYLQNIDGSEKDSLVLPAMRPDVSLGRDSNNNFRFYVEPTPGLANAGDNFTETIDPVQSVVKGGFYTGSVLVSLSRPSGCDVYYTTDGSKPTTDSKKYTAPFTLSKTTVVRSAAFKEGALTSEIATETYFIDEENNMPIVSITVDPFEMFDSTVGMYMPGYNIGDTFPYFGANYWNPDLMLDANMEFFEKNKTRVIQRPMGLKIHGGWSRGTPKKSLALLFKDQYNEGDLAYPIFPDYPEARRFKSLILRTGGGHYQDVMVYDGFNSYLTKGRDIEYQKLRSTKLFINGQYWGLYNIREKLNEHYFTTNFALDESEINMIKDGGVIQQGSIAEYVTLVNFIRHNDLAYEHNYDYVKSQMDIPNFIDYMATEIFIVNTDWPANNIKWWKSNRPNSKWRWILYDTDGLLSDTINDTTLLSDFDMISFATEGDTAKSYPNGADFTFLLRNLLKNSSFKVDFINRTMTLLNTNFSTESYKSKLDYITSFVGDEYKRDFQRWGVDEDRWTTKLENMKDFSERRPVAVRNNFKKYFSLSDPVEISLETEKGTLFVNGMSIGSNLERGYYFPDIRLTLTLSDTVGFKQWSDGSRDPVRKVSVTEGFSLRAEF